ncbi:hypothetical protein BC937DRAFT_90222 [Endogone sp. FLAS-F59071]|nr:hypothetical protein BC937DRAFT_90222 [Endogone sp. FLAS-F59071]|eukprot:RUS22137.1 hypothetical protein BC937DRAFT_90222 [Endogone sp. FLAS-F59071]
MRPNWPLQYARAFRTRPVQRNNTVKRPPIVSAPFVPTSTFTNSPTETSARDKTNEAVSQAASPTTLTPAQLQLVNNIFRKEPTFIKSAASFKQVPTTELPEVAFIGRSNVGVDSANSLLICNASHFLKSTLINLLTNREKKELAKTSNTPGHTRLMNFFNIGGGRLVLVDMPGYGFRSRVEWGDMILEYLGQRKNLRCVFLLINSTHGLKPRDHDALDILNNRKVPYQVVLTKTDKKPQMNSKARKELEKKLSEGGEDSRWCPPLLRVNKKGIGVEELRWAVVKACGNGAGEDKRK